MASQDAERFMEALQETEKSGNVDPLVQLFSESAELKRPSGDETAQGLEGAGRFWREYLSTLGRVRTEFTNVIENGNLIVLEWVSQVDPVTEPGFSYEGVSILEMEDGKVQHFRTYYDSARFLKTDSKDRGG